MASSISHSDIWGAAFRMCSTISALDACLGPTLLRRNSQTHLFAGQSGWLGLLSGDDLADRTFDAGRRYPCLVNDGESFCFAGPTAAMPFTGGGLLAAGAGTTSPLPGGITGVSLSFPASDRPTEVS